MSLRSKIAGAIRAADWRLFFEDYGKQADAVLVAMRKSGYAVVPLEPSKEMLRAGAKALEYGQASKSEAITAVYQAMVKTGRV